MPTRFTRAELVDRALAALKEAADLRLRNEPVPPQTLRFVLAFLAAGHERSAYDDLWKALTVPVSHEVGALAFGRRQTINNLVAFIYRMHGREPVR